MSITPPAWGTMVSETLQFGPRDYIVRRVKVDGPINKVRDFLHIGSMFRFVFSHGQCLVFHHAYQEWSGVDT